MEKKCVTVVLAIRCTGRAHVGQRGLFFRIIDFDGLEWGKEQSARAGHQDRQPRRKDGMGDNVKPAVFLSTIDKKKETHTVSTKTGLHWQTDSATDGSHLGPLTQRGHSNSEIINPNLWTALGAIKE